MHFGQLTKSEADFVLAAADKFYDNIKAHRGDARMAFIKAAARHPFRSATLLKKTYDFEKVMDSLPPQKKAETMLEIASMGYPVFNSAFGEAFAFAVMPPETKSQKMVDICEKMDAQELADFCRKAMRHSP